MAPDYSGNTKGLASEATWEFIITYTLTFACIVLLAIPYKIHFTHILGSSYFFATFTLIKYSADVEVNKLIINLYYPLVELLLPSCKSRQTMANYIYANKCIFLAKGQPQYFLKVRFTN